MTTPRFSIVIPTCNRNHLLSLCLDALRTSAEQFGGDCEFVVTDDSASGEARALIESRYPTMRWVAGPRRGPAANRNHGASLASGEWIIFLDDDCLPDSGILTAYNAATTSGNDVYEGRITCVDWRNDPLEVSPINETGGLLWSCNMMVRREFFTWIGGFDERFPFAGGEDVEFRERLIRLQIPFKWTPEAVVDHPPRKRNLFVKAARREEYQLPLLMLSRVPHPYFSTIGVTVMNAVRRLYHERLSWHWIVSATSLVVQSVAILWLLPQWKRRYGTVFEHPTPRSPEFVATTR